VTSSYYEDEDVFGKVYDAQIAGRLGRYLRPYLAPIIVAFVLVVAVAVLNLVGPLIVREAIDGQIKQGRTDRLGLLVGIYLAALGGAFVLMFAQAVLMTYVGQRVMMDIRLQLFSHVQKMSVSFFDRNPVGRLVTRLTNDIATLEMVLSEGVVETLTSLLMLTAIVVVLLILDWQLALLMLAVLPLLIIAVRYFALSQRLGYRDQRIWLAKLNSYLNEIITGIAVVQLFNRQKRNLGRFDERNAGLLRTNLRIVFWYAVFEPTVVLFTAVTTGLILWYGGGRVIADAMTLGTLVAFIQYMQRFYWPIRDLADRYTTIQQAMASAERIFAVMDEEEEISDVENPVELSRIEGKIEFRNVWFAYDEGNWVLKDVSLTIQPGEKVALVGATGAGKSTMMSLLNRFYEIQKGMILIDDVPIIELRQRSLRRHVGLVLQDPFIFTDTIEENIRMRDRSILLEQVHAAARLVGADAFILRLHEGYKTMLAERGNNLSTGQKQLLALARVAAFNPEIVLVMDEATASIDPETEATLQRSIRQVMEGRTSIIIAHRLNTIRNVDRILVLHQGRLVEEGSHDDLLARRGTYFRLYELQYKDQDIGVGGS
jgi:ATP-binding cassette, subfamily B, multidrug efflux pump